MKKSIIALVACLVLIVLTACGGGKVDPSDPNQGLWRAATGEMMGISMEVEEFFGEGFTIELRSSGKCALNVDGEKANGTWTLENGAFNVKGGGLDCSGRLENGELTLENVMDMGLTLIFAKDGGTAAAGASLDTPASDDADNAASIPSDVLEWWDGQWYGWYIVLEGEGPTYDYMDGRSYDCYAFTDINDDGTGVLYLWDDYEELGTVEFKLDLSGGVPMGTLVAYGGDMFFQELEMNEWFIDPTERGYDDLIYLYEDARLSGEDYMRFEIYLRPWGIGWDDMPENVRPPYYRDWYVRDGFREYDSMMDAIAANPEEGNELFVHPGLPERAYSMP